MTHRRSAACRCVRTPSIVFKLNQTCRVMEVWPGNQAPETSSRPKKARQWPTSKSCWLVTFFDIRGIVHSEFLPQGQTISTKRSCGVCFAQCARKDESCGRTNRGCFTTTLHLLTRPSASRGSSWPRRTSPYWNNLPIHPILLRVTFWFSPSSRGSPREPVVSVEVVEAISRAVTTKLRSIPEESF